MVQLLKKYSVYAILIFLSFFPFLLYGNKQLISVYDGFQYYDIHTVASTWLSENNGSFNYLFIPYDIVIYIILKLIPVAKAIQISLTIPLLVAFITSFRLIRFLTKDTVISIIGSIVYSYSIYGQFMSGWSIHSGSAVFALAPFFFHTFLAITEDSNPIREACKLGLCTIFFINVNLTFVVYLFGLLFSVIIFKYFIESKKTCINLLICFIAVCFLYVLVNSVFFFTFGSEYFFQQNLVSQSLSAETVEWKSSYSLLSELLREMGALNFYYEFLGKTYPHAQIYVTNPFFIFLSYLTPLLALFVFTQKPINRYWKYLKIYVLFILLMSLLMGMGVFESSPTKIIYRFLYQTIPFFSIFRDTYKIMFVINLMYSILISYFLLLMKEQKRYVISCCLVAAVFFINSFQFWTGSFFQSRLIQIPTYWNDLNIYHTSKMQQKNVFMLPYVPFPIYTFTSKRGITTNFYRPLLNFNLIYPSSVTLTYDNSVLELLYKSSHTENFSTLLGFYNIPYVLVQHDIDWKAYQVADPKEVEQDLDSHLNFIHSFK